MEHATAETGAIEAPPQAGFLPENRSEWPDDARTVFRQLVRELDRWCRQHDWPARHNAWIAEEAVRKSW